MMNLLMKLPLVYVTVIATFVAIWSNNAFAQCEVQQMTAPKGDAGYGFGAIAISGDVLAVGDPQAFGSLGVVYIYRRGPDGPGDWILEATLMAPKPVPDDIFGRVAVSGDVVVVTAIGATAPESPYGAAYVYRYSDEKWSYEATLIASDGDFGDSFGRSVSIDENVILISAPEDENGGISQSGSTYIFRYDGAIWVEEDKLTDPEGEQGDLFGISVSILGNVAIVGAHGNDDAGQGTGAVFVFRYDNLISKKWIFEQQLNANDAGGTDWFGFSVSQDHDIALIGAPQQDSQNGAAYVFQFDGNMWKQETKLSASEPVGPFPLFGRAVSINTDKLLVGARHDFALGAESGSAYVFYQSANSWIEVAKLTASDGEAGDFFGSSVAVNRAIGFIGTNRQSDIQTVYIFDLDVPAGDLDCDGRVNLADLITLLSAWGPCKECTFCNADLDGNCIVNTSDLLILFANWG